ncbi:MAG: CHAT domain-containing protein [Actinomycetota bacterium]|nr:CHAT domain-containing protein [Actinomycetota bacterium]
MDEAARAVGSPEVGLWTLGIAVQTPDVSALVRHPGGDADPLDAAWLARPGDEDRIEVSIENPGDATLYVRLIASGGDGVDGLGSSLTIRAGARRTASIAADDLPALVEAIVLVAADDRRTLAGALKQSGISLRLLGTDPDVTLVSLVRARPKKTARKKTVAKKTAAGKTAGTARRKTAAGKTTASKSTARKSTSRKSTGIKSTGAGGPGRTRTSSLPRGTAAEAGGEGPAVPRMRSDDAGAGFATAEPGPTAYGGGTHAANGGGGEAPTRTVHGRLDAPETVTAGEEFVVTAGIREDAQPDVESDAMTLPAGPLTLEVQLLAFGFTLADGESWRRDLIVTDADPWPAVDWHVTASPPSASTQVRSLEVKYALEGQVLGFARRSIGIAVQAADAAGMDVPAPEGHGFTQPAPGDKADLTITISHPEREAPDVFLVSLDSPHPIDAPDRPSQITVGAEAREFARQLIEDVEQREGLEELEEELRGAGRTIAEKLPAEVWRALAAAGKGAREEGREVPTVLLLTAEPHVPWELAYMKEPLDEKRPCFLGAQAVVGRWPMVSTEPPPEKRPPLDAPVQTIAAVSGKYAGRWSDLEHARAEAAKLGADFKAEQVDATMTAIRALFRRKPTPSLLHFAMHGKADDTGFEEGLITVDDRSVTENFVIGSDLSGTPFVFMNACQVGRGAKRLGDYAGLAKAFLERGACGVVAPLWKIDDEAASKIALSFYARVLRDAEHPAEVLRDERAAWLAAPASSTFLAYQFWGHPSLQLKREDAPT